VQPASPSTPPAPAGGSDSARIWAIVGYILPILFFVPLLGEDKNKPGVRFHANQQLVLLLFWVVANVVLGFIPIIGWMLMPVAFIFGIVLMIMGIMNAAQGAQKPLPLIGKIELIK
jgi:uncharacterized membrane protein